MCLVLLDSVSGRLSVQELYREAAGVGYVEGTGDVSGKPWTKPFSVAVRVSQHMVVFGLIGPQGGGALTSHHTDGTK